VDLVRLALALLASCFACTALGLCIGALGLRGRSVSVFADSIGAVMLIVSGANVPFNRLPHVVRTIASGVPLTHGIDAARQLANGASLGHVEGLLGAELAIAVAYFAAGVLLLRVFEQQARTSGSFDRF
jgi:ABC-2 type transport system permease protein